MSLLKVTPPRRLELFPRTRLLERLAAACQHPVVWIGAPAGSGKTTLISSYLEDRALPCIWYECDAADADLATFFHYFREAVRRAYPGWGRLPPLFTPEYQPGPAVFARRWFSDLYERVEPPLLIVLDDVQEVPESSPFYEVLSHGLCRPRDGVHVVALSRRAVPAVLTRHLASRDLAVVEAGEMLLREDEAPGFVTHIAAGWGETVPLDAVRSLYKRSAGWAGGLVLLLQWRRQTGEVPRVVAEDASEPAMAAIFDYFATEVFARVEGATRRVLLQTAFLPSISPGEAQAVTGEPRAGAILADLHRQHTFTERHADAGSTYRYHPLFRAFLLTVARREWSVEIYAERLRRGAEILLESERTEAAIDLLVEAEAWADLEALLLSLAPTVVSQGRGRWLANALAQVPAERVEANAWLQFWLAQARLGDDPAESRSLFEAALDAFEAAGDSAGSYLSWNGATESILLHASLRELDSWMTRFERLRARFPEVPSPKIGFHTASCVLTNLVHRRPGHPDYPAWRRRLIEHAASGGPKGAQVASAALNVVTGDAFMRGQIGEAESALRILTSKEKGPDRTPIVGLVAEYATACLGWLAGDFSACRVAVERGLALGETAGIPGWEVLLVGMDQCCNLCEGRIDDARAQLDRMMAALDQGGPDFRYPFTFMMGTWVSLARGDLIEAKRFHDQFANAIGTAGMRFHDGLVRIAGAMVARELGEAEAAAALLAEGLGVAEAQSHRLYTYAAHLTQADLDWSEGRRDEAHESLRRGLALGRRHGFAVHPFWRREVATRLCVVALEAGIESEYARHLVERHGLVPDPPPRLVDGWPWPVRIRTLGDFVVDLGHDDDGAPRSVASGEGRPVELLEALIAFGGRDVPEEWLSDALWPDAEGDAAHRSFKVNLHRLRKRLGPGEVVQLANARLSLDPGRCWVDTWAFDDVLARLEERDVAASERARLAERLFDLYRGPFLRSEDAKPWSIRPRERLAQTFRRCVAALAEGWERAHDGHAAADCYERALLVDDLAEPFYRGLMRCQIAGERWADAQATWERCRRVLADGLGLEPSNETAALAERIRGRSHPS